jgi:hypothetical protein
MYFAKKGKEEIVNTIEDTNVYACESETCNGWMREEFSTADLSCPICGSNMKAEVRGLPKIKVD